MTTLHMLKLRGLLLACPVMQPGNQGVFVYYTPYTPGEKQASVQFSDDLISDYFKKTKNIYKKVGDRVQFYTKTDHLLCINSTPFNHSLLMLLLLNGAECS